LIPGNCFQGHGAGVDVGHGFAEPRPFFVRLGPDCIIAGATIAALPPSDNVFEFAAPLAALQRLA